MNVKLYFAEAATTHPDGTVSMLRAGITHVWGNKPYGIRGALVIRIESELSETGQHEMQVMCRDEDGKDIMPPIKGQFGVPKGGGHSHLVVNLGLGFPKSGNYVFAVTVDNQEKDRWLMHVGQEPPKQREEP